MTHTNRPTALLATLAALGCSLHAHGQDLILLGERYFDTRDLAANYVRIAASSAGVLALGTDGVLRGWGPNGGGTTTVCPAPRDLGTPASFAAGWNHGIACGTDGVVRCWGYDFAGSLQVPPSATDVVEVAAGGLHSLARRSDGIVVAWGWNDSGQCNVPADLKGAVSVAAGAYHSIAARSDGSVVGWGDNTLGQCTAPADLTSAIAVCAAENFSAAVTADGSVRCWGDNGAGQCDAPPNATQITRLRLGSSSAIALKSDGSVVYWGALAAAYPTAPSNLTDIVDVACAESVLLAVNSSGKIISWGSRTSPLLGAPPGLHTSVSQLAIAGWNDAGSGFALTNEQQIVAWGIDATFAIPEAVVAPVAIAGGYFHRGAILANGTVICWGDCSLGQCEVPLELQVPGLLRATELALGYSHSLALTSGGGVVYWGSGDFGTSAVPPGLRARRIAAGTDFFLAIRVDDGVSAWGSNFAGETTVPPDLGTARDIAAGATHAIALRSDGTVRCWGSNGSLQCDVPAGLGNVRQVAATWEGSLALRADGTVANWGNWPWGLTIDLPPVAKLVTAPFTAVAALLDTDCNADGVPDSTQLDGYDCNGNGIFDACDAQRGLLEDCNGNSIGDECEKQLSISLSSGPIGPVGYQQPVEWTIPRAALAAAPFSLRVRGRGDFSGQLESVTVKIGTTSLGTALAGTSDCIVTPWRQFTGSVATLNGAVDAAGNLTIRGDASIAVDGALCPTGTWLEFELSYVGATSADCNANGLLDSCEIDAGWAIDANANGIIDICESTLASCPADFDQDGFVGAGDLAQILNAWGPATGVPGLDLVPDGVIDGSDLAMLLGAWGVCVE